MKKLLVLFTKGFPFNSSEPFLENEYKLYQQKFDKVLVVAGCKRNEMQTRNLEGENIEVIGDFTLSKDIKSILEAIPYLLKDRMFYSELGTAIKKRGGLVGVYGVIVHGLCGNHRALLAYRWIMQHPEYKVSVIYSYWMQIPAYASLVLKKKLGQKDLRIVSRCHGFDIYSERHRNNYIPFQEQYVRKIDYIAPASQDGAYYLIKKYKAFEKIKPWYLGTNDIGKLNPWTERKPLKMVSCARVVPIKRLRRIADALALIDDFSIEWTHIGGGQELESLVQYTHDRIGKKTNISTNFLGTVVHHEIFSIYENRPFHVFVSVSASEGGAPISICEAMSFGIPVIATAVGGQPEAVFENENGRLLDKEYKDSELVDKIREIAQMPEENYRNLRENSRRIFERKFDAVKNNTKFVNEVLLQQKQ